MPVDMRKRQTAPAYAVDGPVPVADPDYWAACAYGAGYLLGMTGRAFTWDPVEGAWGYVVPTAHAAHAVAYLDGLIDGADAADGSEGDMVDGPHETEWL